MKPSEFSRRVNEHASALKAYAVYLTQEREEANDLLQETYLKAFSNYQKFTEDTNIKGWLYTIMKNTFINNYRRNVKRNTFLDNSDSGYYLDSVSHSSENGASTKLALEDINAAISALPKDLREAFMMNYTGYKYQEIADHFDIPIGTVKTRIHLARQVLKKKLRDYGVSFGLTA